MCEVCTKKVSLNMNRETERGPSVEKLYQLTLSCDDPSNTDNLDLDFLLDVLKEKIQEGTTKFYVRIRKSKARLSDTRTKDKEDEEEEEEEEAQQPSRKRQKRLPKEFPHQYYWPCLICTNINEITADRCNCCMVKIPSSWKELVVELLASTNLLTKCKKDDRNGENEKENDTHSCPICAESMEEADDVVSLTPLKRSRYTNADCKHSVCRPCLFNMIMAGASSNSQGYVELKCPICRREWDGALPFLLETRKTFAANALTRFPYLPSEPVKKIIAAIEENKNITECAKIFSKSLLNVPFFSQVPTTVGIKFVRDSFRMCQNYLTECHCCSVELARLASKTDNRRKFQLLPCGHSICVKCVCKEGIYSGDGSTTLCCKVKGCTMEGKEFRFSFEPNFNHNLNNSRDIGSSSSSSTSTSSSTSSPNSFFERHSEHPLLSLFGPPTTNPGANPFGIPPYRPNRTTAPFTFGSSLSVTGGRTGLYELAGILIHGAGSGDSDDARENTPPASRALEQEQ